MMTTPNRRGLMAAVVAIAISLFGLTATTVYANGSAKSTQTEDHKGDDVRKADDGHHSDDHSVDGKDDGDQSRDHDGHGCDGTPKPPPTPTPTPVPVPGPATPPSNGSEAPPAAAPGAPSAVVSEAPAVPPANASQVVVAVNQASGTPVPSGAGTST